MPPHPDHVDETLLVAGARLRIRPLEPADRASLAALFDRLSAESRRRRFLAPKPSLSARELTYLTSIDHVTHEALAAVAEDGTIAGVSRYASYSGRRDVAEIAVVVADEMQGRGIGTALAGRIVRRARANGLERLTAATLWENRPALALLKGLGFRLREHGSVLELDLDLRAERAVLRATAIAA